MLTPRILLQGANRLNDLVLFGKATRGVFGIHLFSVCHDIENAAAALDQLDLGTELYVGNLNFATTEDELRDLFGQVAPVASVSMIMDRETGRPRGFAFIEMETSEGAQQAIEKLNNRELA